MLISFLRFLCHRERNWPCNTGYPACLISHLLPVPRPDCGVCACFVVRSYGHLGWKFDFIPHYSQAARPRSAFNQTVAGRWTSCIPPVPVPLLSLPKSFFRTEEDVVPFPLIKLLAHWPFSFRLDRLSSVFDDAPVTDLERVIQIARPSIQFGREY